MAHPERDFGAITGGGFDGGFGRGRGRRPVTDYGSTMVYYMKNRHRTNTQSFVPEMERSSPSYIVNMLPPAVASAADCVPAKHLHGSLNKIKHPINVVRWTPEGRRLLTASSSGEFTLWNGMGFNFETIMQAHDSAIRAAVYSNSDEWLLSADQDGIVKYWQPNFNNVKVIQAHTDPIRDLAFAPTDSKFITASDDSTLKIFDFAGGVEESSLTGHGWDVKSVDWHPTKGLIVSGSKDHLVKLWDPRTGRCLTTFHAHKNTISKTLFEKTRGQVLATCARDQQARIFELRMMRDICILKGHEKDISTLAWHPIHSNLLSTGGSDGSLFHYLCDEPNPPPGTPYTLAPWDSPDPATAPAQSIWPAHKVPYAHEFAIWSLDWHPIGHILASGSNDRVTRFWTRARPGEVDCFKDKYHLGEGAAEAQGTWDRRGGRRQQREQEELEGEDEAEGLVDQKMPLKQQALPGIPGLPVPPSAYADGSNVGSFQSLIPGMGAVPPPPPPVSGAGGLPGLGLPGLGGVNPPDFSKLAAMMGNLPPPPPLIPSSGSGSQAFPPPLPLPSNFSFPPGFQFPDFLQQQGGAHPPPPPPPPPSGVIPGLGGTENSFGENTVAGAGALGVRKRAPLPSQQESLKEAQRGGSFRTAR